MQMMATMQPDKQAARRADQVAAEAHPHIVFTRRVAPKELPQRARHAPLARMVAFQQSAEGKQLQADVTREGLVMGETAAEHYSMSQTFGSKRCSTVEEMRFLCERTGNWIWPSQTILDRLEEIQAPGAQFPPPWCLYAYEWQTVQMCILGSV